MGRVIKERGRWLTDKDKALKRAKERKHNVWFVPHTGNFYVGLKIPDWLHIQNRKTKLIFESEKK